MDAEDADLVGRWQRGDPIAFEALVRRWQGPIARFLHRFTGRHDWVRDLSQEVFLRVYQARERYRDNGAFSSWLYRIAINVAQDTARKNRRQAVSLPDKRKDDSPPADVVCQQRELANKVARAITELPEGQRLVLVLRHYEQMSFESIGRLTGVPASTLKSRFAAALARLRSRLEAMGYGPEEA
jgi:RNA polymerase sigma-70 factor (ECF subfamily)